MSARRMAGDAGGRIRVDRVGLVPLARGSARGPRPGHRAARAAVRGSDRGRAIEKPGLGVAAGDGFVSAFGHLQLRAGDGTPADHHQRERTDVLGTQDTRRTAGPQEESTPRSKIPYAFTP